MFEYFVKEIKMKMLAKSSTCDKNLLLRERERETVAAKKFQRICILKFAFKTILKAKNIEFLHITLADDKIIISNQNFIANMTEINVWVLVL